MFFYTLPIIFEQTTLLSPFALVFMGLTLLVVLFISAPTPEPNWQESSAKLQESPFFQHKAPYLYDAWYGDLALWKVFWPFFIILNIALVIGDRLATSSIMSVPTWDTLLIICVITALWWLVAVWRMSAHTSSRIWIALARLCNLSAFFDFVLRVYIRKQYPRIFFDCQSMLFDYSSCF